MGLCLNAQAFDVPRLTGPVVDQVGLLSSQAKSQLEQSLQQFLQSQKIQIQVFVVSSLNEEAIESVAIQVFDQWKLGDKKTDMGLLFLIAPKEKKLRIEVGQGLEGVIPDITAKRIISEVITPYFKQGNFDQGVLAGVSSLQNFATSGNYDENLSDVPVENQKSSKGGWIFLILLGLWILIFLISPTTGLYILASLFSGGRGGGGSMGSGSGGWSGGGGSSSGGGASGGW